MTVLPEPTPTAPAAGQAVTPLSDAVIQAAVRDIINQTSYRDPTPVPKIGTALPVPQPGRPPMSQRATDISTVTLAAGAAAVPIGGSASLVLYTLGHVDPTALAIGAAAPVALILALGGLLRRVRGALPETHHHHYEGVVYQDQRSVQTKNTGVWAKTNNHP
ncbi:hypothetical protein ACF1BS_03420 [Streptomyces sp. NPDC014748]|uniref:hypothetical protein n=1 Tax=Streptomyces sp. NPDC014748 TaxID=3364905 RepID=UPI0036F86324